MKIDKMCCSISCVWKVAWLLWCSDQYLPLYNWFISIADIISFFDDSLAIGFSFNDDVLNFNLLKKFVSCSTLYKVWKLIKCAALFALIERLVIVMMFWSIFAPLQLIYFNSWHYQFLRWYSGSWVPFQWRCPQLQLA